MSKSPHPQIDAEEAVRLGFEHTGGSQGGDQVTRQPSLEFWPADPEGWGSASRGVGALGKGYSHYLVWVFEFLRLPDEENWEVAVDAVSGEVVSFHDLNTYATKKIKGGVYPAASNSAGPCQVCGVQQSGYPMPWADTGLPAPNDFTNSAGVFDYGGGTVTTTLTGRYADITDRCGTISVSSANGDINLGGTDEGSDCFVPPGTSPGNTASARTVFYEFNKIAEIGRSWLPYLATRDLPAQHGYDLNTSFIVASRILYQSDGDTSAWHSCSCTAGTSDGCGVNSGYNQWITEDDDNANPLDGTPHMVAIYNAFNRHGIACPSPTVQNSGCAGGPTTSPSLTVEAACGAVDLSWTSVPGALNYQVFRTEGHNGCDLGKALVAAGPQTSYHDTAVADGREYSYMVIPITGTESCVGPGSACFAATPTPITGAPVVTVSWPNGGNVLYINTAVNLTWTAADTCGGVASVDLHLSRNGPGGPFEVIALGIPNSGSYNWVVTGPSTTNGFIRVTAHDPGMNSGSDLSNAAFRINSGCGPCPVSWCKEEALRCTWNNTCGPGACCNYTCAYDPNCPGAETCPEDACSC